MRRLLLVGLLFGAAIGIGNASAETNTTYFLIASKAKAIDSPILQRRGITAATKVSEAANRIFPDVKLQLLIEPETTPQKIRTGNAQENVTKKKFYDHLLDLATSVQPDDTVFIYTHTHTANEHLQRHQNPAVELYSASQSMTPSREVFFHGRNMQSSF